MSEKPDVKGVAKIGRTPQQQLVSETPGSRPVSTHTLFGVWGNWLGDPDTRYGRRRSSKHVAMSIKLEMLYDPVIALCQGFMASKLVNAKYEILCADDGKRRFFQAMYDAFHHEFMLQAAPAIALGSLGLIKKLRFQAPHPQSMSADPVWPYETTPLVCTGFDQIYPAGARPVFDPKTYKFVGIEHSGGKVDVYYSLWLTMGKAAAFGGYMGKGRLDNAYGDWWLKQFARDLYVLHMQKNVDRSVEMGYPPGQDANGKTYRDYALEIGDSLRAGATIALPTTVYETPDSTTGEMRPSNIKKWTAGFKEGSENVGAFHEMDDHSDQKIALAMFVPPQTFMNVKQSSLGGPTTADVLSELAVDLLLMDAVDIDRHLNEYVFPIVDRANFPPGTPPVTKRTTGLIEKDREELMEVVKSLILRAESEVPFLIDVPATLERLGIPMVESGNPLDTEPDESALALESDTLDEAGWFSRETLERIAQEQLPDDGEQAAAMVGDEDELRQLKEELQEEIPELSELETV